VFLGRAGGLREFLAKSCENGGPPGLRCWLGVGMGGWGLYSCSEGGESGGEPLVGLVRGGGLGGWWDQLFFDLVGQVRPVGVLPACSGFVIMVGRRPHGNSYRVVVGPCGRRVEASHEQKAGKYAGW